jgi:hypothetical protein
MKTARFLWRRAVFLFGNTYLVGAELAREGIGTFIICLRRYAAIASKLGSCRGRGYL